MRFGSLFSGIGGMDLGLERAGMECVWQVEIDDYCQRVLAKHWPDVERFADVREVGKHNLAPVDLIAGGFPCQPHSVAGKRAGAADDRNLWPEYLRIVRELEPRYVLGENVPGLRTTMLDTVLSDLENAGYTVWTFNIPACALDAPHRRERLFIVARRERMGRKEGASEGVQSQEQKQEGQEPQHICEGISETKDVAYCSGKRIQGQRASRKQIAEIHGGSEIPMRDGCHGTFWTVEPDVGRVAHGVPNRVDRLRGLGNAVVPQVAEYVGRMIMQHSQ